MTTTLIEQRNVHVFFVGNRFINPDRAQHSHLHEERPSAVFLLRSDVLLMAATMPRLLYHCMSQPFFFFDDCHSISCARGIFFGPLASLNLFVSSPSRKVLHLARST